MTPDRSLLSEICFTSPTSTFLYLIFVLPASRPSAVLKVIVIVGPRSWIAFTASHPPITTATIGISQTIENNPRRFGATAASGTSKSRGALAIGPPQRIPNEARVKTLRREHREDHDRSEGDGPWPGLDRRQGLELNERGKDRRDIDIHHGPAAD